MTHSGPPRHLRRLLVRWLGGETAERDAIDRRREFLEELDFEYDAVRRRTGSKRRADWWYAGQLFSPTTLWFVWLMRRGYPRGGEMQGGGRGTVNDVGAAEDGPPWWRGFPEDLRVAARRLSRSPLVSVAIALTLAVVLAANGIVFDAVRALLLKPLPFDSPERVVHVYGEWPERGWSRTTLSSPNLADLSGQPFIAALAPYRTRDVAVVPEAGVSEMAMALETDAALPVVLGTPPVLGRWFTPAELGPDAGDRVVVLAHDAWTRWFAADPAVLGRTLVVDGIRRTVVGVMAAGVAFPEHAATAYLPAPWSPSAWPRSAGGLHGVAKLAPGWTPASATPALSSFARSLEAHHPDANAGLRFSLVPLMDDYYGPDIRALFLALAAAVLALLLVAGVNLTNLFAARATERQQELVVRSALGASRVGIMRVVLAESVFLTGAGSLFGVALAWPGYHLLQRFAPRGIPRIDQLSMNPGLLAATALSGVVLGLVVGLLAARGRVTTDIAAALRQGTRGGRKQTRGRGVGVMTAVQVGLTAVVLFWGLLTARSFRKLLDVDMGFQPEGVVAFRVGLTARYASPGEVDTYRGTMLERLRALPSVTEAATVTELPLAGSVNLHPVETPATTAMPEGARPTAAVNPVTPGYFQALGIPIERGPGFARSADTGEPEVVVSRALADRLWPVEDPIGQRVRGSFTNDTWATVVAVVGDVRPFGPRSQPQGMLYLRQPGTRSLTFVARADGDASRLTAAIRGVAAQVDPNEPIYDVTTLSALRDRSIEQVRSLAWALTLLGGLTLLLVMIGIGGVAHHAVVSSIREISIRAALGADAQRTFSLIMRREMVAVATGTALGLILAVALSAPLTDLLFDVSPRDPLTLLMVSAEVIAVAAGVLAFPAMRAVRADPMRGLSSD